MTEFDEHFPSLKAEIEVICPVCEDSDCGEKVTADILEAIKKKDSEG